MKFLSRMIILFSFLVMSQYAKASNSVYIDQIGSGSTIVLTQTGTANKIGDTTKAATINGDNNTITIDQIGDGNELRLDVGGTGATVTSAVTGNNNLVDISCGAGTGTCSTSAITNTITGDGNTLLQKSDNLIDSTVTIDSNNNQVDIENTSTAILGAKTLIDISAGDSNVVIVKQTGVAAINGHDITMTVVGATNNIDIKQGGTVDSKIITNITGSANNLSIKSNHP
jgi:hypothetical protein